MRNWSLMIKAIVSTLVILGASTSSMAAKKPKMDDFAQLGFVKIDHHTPKGVNNIRLQGIRESAMSLGARGALAWRANHINATLEHSKAELNRIFNFRAILIDNKILPPILTQNGPSIATTDQSVLRTSQTTYRLIQPARFVTTAPTWRDYLIMNFKKPSVPDSSLAPKNKAEVQAWNYYLKMGWNQGIEQANAIFSVNLNRLKRDFNGMILYRILLAKNMVLAPHMATADLGITGDSNHIRVGDRIYRITANSSLQTNSQLWSPVIVNQRS